MRANHDSRGFLDARRLAILHLLGLLAPGCFEAPGQTEKSEHASTTSATPTVDAQPTSSIPDLDVATSASSTSTADAAPPASSSPFDAASAHTRAACGVSTPIEERPGYERCESGLVHRAAVVPCVNDLAGWPEPDGESLVLPITDAAALGCSSHGECAEKDYGYCVAVGTPSPVDYQCAYGCTTDQECDGHVCHCRAPIGACTYGDCTSDADCGLDLLCVEIPDWSGCGAPPSYACQTATDECATSTDCTTPTPLCAPKDGRWVCTGYGAMCGRPFLVADAARVASLSNRADWQRGPRVESATLSARDRAALGKHWTEVALMEHASIAAFARFTLQLLHVGAPAELVAASAQATADETLHAELAFGLASTYLGRSVGPSALDLSDAHVAMSLGEMVRLVVREGCIGETVAALEARQALQHCTEQRVRDVLERIAQDEAAHSDLAWRFLRWAIDVQPALLEDLLAESRALTKSHSTTNAGAIASDSAELRAASRLRAHGLLPPHERARLQQDVLARVVTPCLGALTERRAA